MNDKYEELGNVLKAYTQATADPNTLDPKQQRDLAVFGNYLRAAIDNSDLSREQIAQQTNLSAVELFALERGLLSPDHISPQTLRRLATVLNEDITQFALLLNTVDLRSDVEQPAHLFTNMHSPAQTDSKGRSSRFRFFAGAVRYRSPLLLGTIAATLLIVLFSPNLMEQIFNVPSPQPAILQSPINLPSLPQTAVLHSPIVADQISDQQPEVYSLILPGGANFGDSYSASRQSSANPPPDIIVSQSAEAGIAFSDSFRASSANDAFATEQNAQNSGLNLPPPEPRPTLVLDAVQPLSDSPVHDATESDSDSVILADRSLALISPLADGYPAPTRADAAVQRNAAPAFRNMVFQDYGINAFTETVLDNLSTFAVDVDTGSYTIARNIIRDGFLPPPESILVEDFVNFFDYDYPTPTQGDTFAIHLDAFSSPFVERRIGSEEAANVQLMRIGLQGVEILPSERPDVALTFVIDVSGSMGNGGRLTLVKRSLTMLVERLRPTDTIGIVAYSTAANVILSPTKAAEKNTILDAIYTLRPQNTTNVAAGLRSGYDLAWRNFQENAVNRVILASDGVVNTGVTQHDEIWGQVKQYADRGITLTSIGVGLGSYNDVIMEQLANMGDGVYGYVDTIDEAERLFVDDLTGTLVTIAKDVKVQVEFNPDVVGRYRLIGYENRDIADADFRNNSVDAGEVGSGHSVTALYEVELLQSGEAATVIIRWEDVNTGDVAEINKTLNVEMDAAPFADAPGNFQLAAVVATLAEELRNGLWHDAQLQTRGLSEGLRNARQLAENIKENEEVTELFWLVEEAGRLSN